MISDSEKELLNRFVAAVREADRSPEAIAEELGRKPSGPTIRRYLRGDYPKGRLDPQTRRGIERFMTSRTSSPGLVGGLTESRAAFGAHADGTLRREMWARFDAIDRRTDLTPVQREVMKERELAVHRLELIEAENREASHRIQLIGEEARAANGRTRALEHGAVSAEVIEQVTRAWDALQSVLARHGLAADAPATERGSHKDAPSGE